MDDNNSIEYWTNHIYFVCNSILKSKTCKKIPRLNNKALIAATTMAKYYCADCIARIHGVDCNNLDNALTESIAIVEKLKPKNIAEYYIGTNHSNDIIFLTFNYMCFLTGMAELSQRFEKKPIILKSYKYFGRSTYDSMITLLTDAAKMAISGLKKQGVSYEKAPGQYEIIRAWTDPEANIERREERESGDEFIAYQDYSYYQFDAADKWTEKINESMKNISTGNFKNLPQPSVYYSDLKSPSPEWDNYLLKEIILSAKRSINTGLPHIENAEKIPFEIQYQQRKSLGKEISVSKHNDLLLLKSKELKEEKGDVEKLDKITEEIISKYPQKKRALLKTIWAMMCEGKTQQQISDETGKSRETINTYSQELRKKIKDKLIKLNEEDERKDSDRMQELFNEEVEDKTFSTYNKTHKFDNPDET